GGMAPCVIPGAALPGLADGDPHRTRREVRTLLDALCLEVDHVNLRRSAHALASFCVGRRTSSPRPSKTLSARARSLCVSVAKATTSTLSSRLWLRPLATPSSTHSTVLTVPRMTPISSVPLLGESPKGFR